MLPIIVHRHDGAMFQASYDAGFLFEAIDGRGVVQELGGQHLDSNIPIHRDLMGAEHGSHTALPNDIQDRISA